MPFDPNDLSELDELTEEHLGFSALSSGLGFAKKTKGPHPAAQKGQANPAPKALGQPPAGASARSSAKDLPSMALDEEDEDLLPSRSSGSGAVSGGPIWTAPSITQGQPAQKPTPTWTAQVPGSQPQRPIPPSNQPPVFQAKTYTPSQPATTPSSYNPAPNYNSAPSYAPAAAIPTVRTQGQPSITTAAPSAAQVLAEPAASQGLRIAAFVLDALFILLPLTAAWMVSFGADAKEIFLSDTKSPLLLFAAIFGAYFLLSESFGGQSLGKMALGLRVVEDDKYQKPAGLRHAAVRLLLTVLGALFFGMGLLASFWDSKRRPWQDRYTGSIVRRQA